MGKSTKFNKKKANFQKKKKRGTKGNFGSAYRVSHQSKPKEGFHPDRFRSLVDMKFVKQLLGISPR